MHDMPRAHETPTVFVIPDHAHLELVQIRDHLRLLTRLTEPGTAASDHDMQLRPHAMSWWFSRLSRDIDHILEETYWSEAAANA